MLSLLACVHAPPAAPTPPSPELHLSEVEAVDASDVEAVWLVGGRTFVFADAELLALGDGVDVRWRAHAEDADAIRFSVDGAHVVVANPLGCITRIDSATGERVTHERTVNPAGWDTDATATVAWSTAWMTPTLVGRRFDGGPDFEVPVSRDELEADVWVHGDLALLLGSDDLVVRALPGGEELARTRAGNRQLCRFSGDRVGWVDGDRQGALDARTLTDVPADEPCGPPQADGHLPLPDGSEWVWESAWLRRTSPSTRTVAAQPLGDLPLPPTEPSRWDDGRLVFAASTGPVYVEREDYTESGWSAGDVAVIDGEGWVRAVDLRTGQVLDRLRIVGPTLYEGSYDPSAGWTLWLGDDLVQVGPRP